MIFPLWLSALSLRDSALQRCIYPSPLFFAFFKLKPIGSGLNLCFVGRISDSVIRQDHAILLGYAALTQPTNKTYKQQVPPTTNQSLDTV